MSVLLETSVGDLVIDLEVDKAPRTCDNFLKLCAIKYYNDCTFHTVRRDHSVQTGDPTNTGSGGQSIHALLAAQAGASADSSPSPSRFLQDELDSSLTHARLGTVGMSNLAIPHSAASQFYITTAPGLHSLDQSHTVFGHVAEGLDVLERLNAAVTDERGRPTVHIRIRHVAVLDDPFPMTAAVAALVPPHSPQPVNDPYDYENINATTRSDDSKAADSLSTAAAANPQAVVLEMIGDLPSADVAPPENVLFVCKLNPVTRDDDLQLIFSRFGPIRDCSIVRDAKTAASLCYAFIEYDRKEDCEAAYVKMDNVLIDDRRIRVDFSQSVSRQWTHFARNKRSAQTAQTAQQARQAAAGPMTTVGKENAAEAGKERRSRWGEGRPQPSTAPHSAGEERRDSRAVEERARQKRDEKRDGGESSERRHGGERRHRSRERSPERPRWISRSRSRSRSRERHNHSRREPHGEHRDRGRDKHRERDKDRQRASRDRDKHTEDRRNRHRRSRSPERRH